MWKGRQRAAPFISALLSLAFLGAASLAVAGNVKVGKTISVQCSVSHGTDGLSKMVEAHNLAGQPPAYLEEQLRNYRSGKDICGLAAWFSAIQIAGYFAKISIEYSWGPGIYCLSSYAFSSSY